MSRSFSHVFPAVDTINFRFFNDGKRDHTGQGGSSLSSIAILQTTTEFALKHYMRKVMTSSAIQTLHDFAGYLRGLNFDSSEMKFPRAIFVVKVSCMLSGEPLL